LDWKSIHTEARGTLTVTLAHKALLQRPPSASWCSTSNGLCHDIRHCRREELGAGVQPWHGVTDIDQ